MDQVAKSFSADLSKGTAECQMTHYTVRSFEASVMRLEQVELILRAPILDRVRVLYTDVYRRPVRCKDGSLDIEKLKARIFKLTGLECAIKRVY
jgi:hypothetical protein